MGLQVMGGWRGHITRRRAGTQAHTVLVTKHGRMMMAMGNHRYGQLGVSGKNEKTEVLLCDDCLLVEAQFECR